MFATIIMVEIYDSNYCSTTNPMNRTQHSHNNIVINIIYIVDVIVSLDFKDLCSTKR